MRKEILKFAVLLMVAIGAGPAAASLWQWSQTAGNNATSDPSINWSEGMSPSSVNDSARAMMAVVAKYRDDISGTLATSGSGTAYTISTNSGNLPSPPSTGQMLAFTPHVTNGVAATLVTDGGSAYPFQITAGTALPAATLIAGTPYRASFNGTAWVMEAGYANPYGIPLGGFLHSTLPTPPNSNFIMAYGQCISSTTYNAYFLALGSPASGSCPGGQFAVIDVRGRNLTALDNLGGTPANRLTTSLNGCGVSFYSVGISCTQSGESQTLGMSQLPAVAPTVSTQPEFQYGRFNVNSLGGQGGGSSAITGFDANVPTAATRTQNVVMAPLGGGLPHPVVAPNIAVTVFLRVL